MSIREKNAHIDEYFKDQIILSTQNDVDNINNDIIQRFLKVIQTFLSATSVILEVGVKNCNVYPIEYLNYFELPSLSPAKLHLKVGCPIMLLRNITPKHELCNGSQLIVTHLKNRVIEAQILIRNHVGEITFIPRITLQPTTLDIPFKFSRKQFPMKVALAMTINKSQGQSVEHGSLDLRTPIFSLSQLYVALSPTTYIQF
jgi:ATP-dependent exoDNAse (exonuclease V) alpha subunit